MFEDSAGLCCEWVCKKDEIKEEALKVYVRDLESAGNFNVISLTSAAPNSSVGH